MQNVKILPIITLGLILATLAANHLVTRLDFVKAKVLSIDAFPRQIGGWTAGPDRQSEQNVEAEVRKVIPTAHTVDRLYSDKKGRSVELTLVTASEYNDLHNPMHCLPAAGWQLSPLVACQIGEDQATSAVGAKDGEQMEVLYWYTASTYRYDSAAERFRAIRTLAGGTQGNSLLVRLITNKTPQSQQLLRDFGRDIQDPLQSLKDEARRR